MNPTTSGRPFFSLETVQLHWGGLFDTELHDGLIHLGDPEDGKHLLCGHDLFAEGGPGFSRGGGVSGPRIDMKPCEGCVAAARERHPGLPIAGMDAASVPMAVALGVPSYSHMCNVPAYRDWEAARRREREAMR